MFCTRSSAVLLAAFLLVHSPVAFAASREQQDAQLQSLVALVRSRVGATPGTPQYDEDFDIDGNGGINFGDALMLQGFEALSDSERRFVSRKIINALRSRIGMTVSSAAYIAALDLDGNGGINFGDELMLRDLFTALGAKFATLSVAMFDIGTSAEAEHGQRNVPLAAFQIAASAEDVTLTTLQFFVLEGSYANAHNYALWADMNGDTVVETKIDIPTTQPSQRIVFDNLLGGGLRISANAAPIRLELRADIAESPLTQVLALTLASNFVGYIEAERFSSGEGLTGTQLNGVCPVSWCEVIVSTRDVLRLQLSAPSTPGKQIPLLPTTDLSPPIVPPNRPGQRSNIQPRIPASTVVNRRDNNVTGRESHEIDRLDRIRRKVLRYRNMQTSLKRDSLQQKVLERRKRRMSQRLQQTQRNAKNVSQRSSRRTR